MSRYIEYDAIDYRNYRLHDKSEEFLNGVIYMAQRIEEAPSIDIVRCIDCKWYKADKYSGVFRCHQGLSDAAIGDFCSFGKTEQVGKE